MKTLIFSDTHLTHYFDEDLFDYIAKLVKNADQVVINGDFWDAYLTTFDQFYNSEWQKLFPLLKKKKTIYVTGNHDKPEFMDERVYSFCEVQTIAYSFESEGKKYNVQHGHLISPAEDIRWVFKNPNFIRTLYRLLVYTKENSLFLKNIIDTVYQEKKDKEQLEEFIEYAKKYLHDKTYFIFGHCHIKHSDQKNRIFTAGFLKDAEFSYVIIENGKITVQVCKKIEKKK